MFIMGLYYRHKEFGLFGWNSFRIQDLVKNGIREVLREEKDTTIRVMVRDLNPTVFGTKGQLNRFLESYSTFENVDAGVLATQDTWNVQDQIPSGVRRAVSSEVCDAFEGTLFPNIGEFVFAWSNDGAEFSMLYNRREDRYYSFFDSKVARNDGFG